MYNFYYSILLLTGNDIMPQTSTETVFCIVCVLLGAFLEAVVFGGIASEM